jgi:hypothetical protein
MPTTAIIGLSGLDLGNVLLGLIIVDSFENLKMKEWLR